ncbi:MAG TPA: peptide-methionine (R)-S-oxide reductase MsrB [Lysobacter sp.]
MNRRQLLQGLAAMAAMPWLSSCSRASDPSPAAGATAVMALNRPDAYWRDKVSAAAYAVLFKDGTERAFSSPLDSEKRPGTYLCAACHLPLFDSRHKFDSGTGWPSFTQPIPGHVATRRDFKLILPRTEYHCARCGGHQGHVFDDGPPPRGERWCNNGVALRFVPKGEPLPPLRG